MVYTVNIKGGKDMITSTIFDGIYCLIEEKIKIEQCVEYKQFCECKEKFLAELSLDMQKKFNDLMNIFENLQEELNYHKNVVAQNYGIKIGMELEAFFESI